MLELIAILVLPLATWRISNMLADYEQSGPFGILDKLRMWAGVRFDEHSMPITKPGSLAQLIICVYCNSIWVGLLFTLGCIVSIKVTTFVGMPFALSAVAIIVQEHINGK